MLLLAIGLVVATVAQAAIPEPSHVVYGRPMVGGQVVTAGLVTLELEGSTEVLASYQLGTDPSLAGLFALRVPLDSVGNRLPGTARTGDHAQILLDGTPAGEVTIGERGVAQNLDIDPQAATTPVLIIGDVAVMEGDSGTTTATFTISLSKPAENTVTVNWATANDTATTADNDYTGAGGVATINVGDSFTTVAVTVKGDTKVESDESFFVNLTGPTNATILDPQARGTILDDDTPPVMTINNVNVVQPTSGTIDAVFRVSLNHSWKNDVSVQYATANGTAVANTDYLSASGTLTIPHGALLGTITVQVKSGSPGQADRTFFVNLANPVQGSIQPPGQGQGIIASATNFLNFIEQQANGINATGISAASGVAVSPDGDHVYVAGFGSASVAAFSRDHSTGALDNFATYTNGSGGVSGLAGATAVMVTPDGKHVYVAGYTSGAVAIFSRDTDSGSLSYGALSFVGTVTNANLGRPTALLSDPNPSGGHHVYVIAQANAAGTVPAAVLVYLRNAVTGGLTLVETEQQGVNDPSDPGVAVNGLDGAEGAAISPDGAHVYVTGSQHHTLASFTRTTDTGDPAFGRLSFLEVHQDGVGGVDGLAQASSVAVSSDGKHVYVTGFGDDAIAIFGRGFDSGDADFGELDYIGKVSNGGGVQGLIGVRSVVVTPQDDYVYAASQVDNAVVVFHRNQGTGALTYVEVKKNGVGGVGGLNGAFQITTSPDDSNVYVASYLASAVAVFQRDLDPPNNPTTLISVDHQVGAWSNLAAIHVQWSGASDNGSGLEGYSTFFDAVSNTTPDNTVDVQQSADPHSQAGTFAEGTTNFFHLRTCDHSGNCSNPMHLGPFLIDLTKPTNPATIGSDSHTANSPSPLTRIHMLWTAPSDNLSGVNGFAYKFTSTSAPQCNHVSNLAGSATEILGPPLPNGNWYFQLCTRDAAGNWSDPVTPIGPFIIQTVDDVAPGIDTFQSVGSTGSSIANGALIQGVAITQLLAEFSEPVVHSDPDDVTSAINPDNFQLVFAGANNAIDTTSCGGAGGDDEVVQLADVRYDVPSHTTAVSFGDPDPDVLGRNYPGLPAGNYQFRICATLTDTSGLPLDGNADGTGGDDFVRTFTVPVDNMLLNPNLDRDMSFWVPSPAATPEVAFDSEDENLTFASGSARLHKQSALDTFAIYQCVDLVTGHPSFALSGKVRMVSDVVGDPVADGTVLFFDVPTCGAGTPPAPIGSAVTNQAGASLSPGSWVTISVTGTQPDAAASALVVFTMRNTAASTPTANFDNLMFSVDLKTIFRSVIEDPSFADWSHHYPP